MEQAVDQRHFNLCVKGVHILLTQPFFKNLCSLPGSVGHIADTVCRLFILLSQAIAQERFPYKITL